MPRPSLFALAAIASLLTAAYAKTDIGGCTSTATTNQWGEASMLWYVPGTGEICELLDCGGGRAPPKYNVPGCAAYTGTETYSPKFLTFSTAAPAPVETGTTTAAPTDAESTTAAAEESETASGGVSTSASPSASVSGSGVSTVVTGVTTSPAVTDAATTTMTTLSGTETASESAPAQQTDNAAAGLTYGREMIVGVMAVAGLAML